MYISSTNASSIYQQQLSESSSATNSKSLVDYMNDNGDSDSSGFSDVVQLSPEAYSAIKAKNPDLLSALGYSSDDKSSDSLLETVGSSAIPDKVEISDEAYAALKKSNPEVLEALGYDLSADTDSE